MKPKLCCVAKVIGPMIDVRCFIVAVFELMTGLCDVVFTD
jgi:hypothetical protein